MFINKPYHDLIMFNYFQNEQRGRLLESLIECTAEKAGESSVKCDMITEPILLLGKSKKLGLGATILGPSKLNREKHFFFLPSPTPIHLMEMICQVYPSRDTETLTGFYGSSIQWLDVLQDSFPKEVNGIDCVIETSKDSFTYRIIDGEAEYM